MKNSILSFTMVAAIALSGCAMSPSKPLTFDQLGQFSSVPLNSQTYRISFVARHNINYGMAQEITLVKAAQTTLQNGFRYFKVLDDPISRNQPPRQTVVYSTPSYAPYGYYGGYSGFWPTPFYDTPQVVNIEPVQISYTIECYRDQTKSTSNAFDARLILQSLGPKYGLNSNGQILAPLPPQTK